MTFYQVGVFRLQGNGLEDGDRGKAILCDNSRVNEAELAETVQIRRLRPRQTTQLKLILFLQERQTYPRCVTEEY